MWAKVLFLIIVVDSAKTLPPVLNIGIVLPEEQTGGPIDFGYKWALKVLNKDKILLPNTTLVGKPLYVKSGDTFRASKQLCTLLGTGVVAILGGASDVDPSLEWKLFWTSATMDVPLFFSTPSYVHYKSVPQGAKDRPDPEFAIRLSPTLQVWGQVLRELTKFLGLKSVAVLYEDEKGLMRTQALLREPAPVYNIIVRRVSVATFKTVLEEIKSREIRHLIVDIKLSSLSDFLKTIADLYMTDYKYHYMLTNLDLSTLDMTGFVQHHVNLTSFQIVNQESKYLNEKWIELKNFGDKELNMSYCDQKKPSILTETAFAFDSVMALGLGLSTLDVSHKILPANLSCDSDVPWADGLSLLNYITATEFKGLSGDVAFKEGTRSSLQMDITRLEATGWKKVGMWTPDKLLNITKPRAFWDTGATNVTLVVTCVLEAPYVQLRQGSNLTGNSRFEGFSIDLLKVIAERVGFKYVLEVVPDGKYGVYDQETGEWNGVVKQLVDKSVDLAIGAITINYARESVIDFTKPFMHLGISILFKPSPPSGPPTGLFSFLNPLALEIWLSVGISYILVSLTMFIVARFSPKEWSATTAAMTYAPSRPVPGVVRNQFTLTNAFWYPIGTLMQQGSDLNPKTASTRIVGGIWWFFSLVIVSSYTANLAAFLTVERLSNPIESAEDLVEQSEISYGSLESGSTMTFFRDSKIATYQKMWRFMESRKPSVFTSSYSEGIRRVLDGNYAFLMESTTIDYVVKQNCNLTQIGGLLDSKGYGIALPKGSPWRDKISVAILEIQENSVSTWYYEKWWSKKTICQNEIKKASDTKASALGVDSIGGIFVVLLIGLTIAITVAVVEFCWSSKLNTNSDQVSLSTEMAEEARFAFRCGGSRRRPAFSRQCGKCQVSQDKSQEPAAYVQSSFSRPHQNNINGFQPQ